MQNLGLNEIRELYLSFFESKGHLRLPSFSLVPKNDPSILLINAGMTPMKPYFKGVEEPPRRRVTTCQKCVRTPDIDRVGLTDRHGTFFEMLGNFSFGDYFKAEMIPWAWEFCTTVLKLPEDRLAVTVYHEDDEAYNIWRDVVGLPESKIYRMGKEDNFWEHGTGPCGPCSEIFFDRGEAFGCERPDCGVGCDCDRYIEFWNLVFTQFDRQEDDSYLPLSQKNIDTGAGLERIACLMQGVNNLFETDTVRAVLDKVCELAGVSYHQDEKIDVGIRVVTDHIRSGTMLISDGVRPSNEGRGYVLRRLLRRALRYGKMIGIQGNFLTALAPVVIQQSSAAYPELEERKSYILSVLEQEEETFKKTVDQGMQLLGDLIEQAQASGKTCLDGEAVFRLHDTYGFPFDLTRELAQEQGLSVDEAGFKEQMAKQKQRSKEATLKLAGSAWTEKALPDCVMKGEPTRFTGYDTLTDEGRVLAIVQILADGEAKLIDLLEAGQSALVVLDQTPFYANGGGQVGDRGLMTTSTARITVMDTTKVASGVHLHQVTAESGVLAVGETVMLTVDRNRRQATAANHSTTHLLHKVLRDQLGEHVTQAGSSVNPERLRFDFHYGQPLTREQLNQIEDTVNAAIWADYPVKTELLSQGEAKARGAMALFDEKYGDVVRVLSMGDFSCELCGGTHLKHTAEACLFKIVSEGSVASGIRRIEAVTGPGAFAYVNEQQNLLLDMAKTTKTTVSELPNKLQHLLTSLKSMEKEIADLKRAQSAVSVDQLKDQIHLINGISTLAVEVTVADAKLLRELAEKLRDQLDPAVVLLASSEGGKVMFVAVAAQAAIDAGAHCGQLIKAAATACGGGGGGRPDMAQAGGKQPEKLQAALQAAQTVLEAQLS